MGWFFIKNVYGYAYDEYDEQLLTAVIIHKKYVIHHLIGKMVL